MTGDNDGRLTAGWPKADTVPFALGMFSAAGSPPFLGIVLDDEAVVSLHGLAPLAATLGLKLDGRQSLFDLLQNWETNFLSLCRLVQALADDHIGHGYRGTVTPIDLLQVHAPISVPRQIICVTETYDPHAAGSEPLIRFAARLPSTLSGPSDKIVLPALRDDVTGCAQLGVVLGRTAHYVPRHRARHCIAGYMVTNRILSHAADTQATEGMAFLGAPTFLPTGPLFVPSTFLPSPSHLFARMTLNGEVVQNEPLATVLHTLPERIEALTARHLMLPGDVVCIGTPVGRVSAPRPLLIDGDVVEAAIDGLGRQTSNVIQERRD